MSCLAMAERYRHGIGRVRRPGQRAQPEELLHHELHLLLGGAARTDDGVLDLRRRVLRDRDVTQGTGEHRGAPRVPEHHRGPDIVRVEDRLDRERVNGVPLEHFLDALEDLAQPDGQGLARLGPDHPALQKRNGAVARASDDAIPGGSGTRVDPEYDHAPASAKAASSMSAFEKTFCTSSRSSSASISLISFFASSPATATVFLAT